MTDQDLKPLFAAAAANLVFNAPLSEERVADLVRRLALADADRRVLDLGCGSGELLRRLCRTYGVAGDGVEYDPAIADRARAATTGLDQVTFHTADATTWTRPADVVVNVGGSHIWDGTAPALAALHRLTGAGGRLLFGEGFYRTVPTDQVREVFGDLPDLAGLARLAVAAGFRPLHVAESTLAEWDDFESDWRAGIEQVGTPQARAFADRRREEYLGGYRGVLGFAWLILMPA